MNTIQYRWATPKDGAEILAIYAPNVLENAVSFEEILPSVAEMEKRIQTVTQQYPWIVATEKVGDQTRIIGYAYASNFGERASYRWSVEATIYLADGMSGKGIGHALYERLHASLKKQAYVNAYARISLPNPASIRLHEKLGYHLIGVYKNAGYKLGQWRDVARYGIQLNLPTDPPAPPKVVDLSVMFSE
jgi:L-amino acid N-acyltransferase YncA